MEWWIGLGGSVLIAGAAYAKRSLSGSGLAAAVVLGTVMYGIGSAVWFGTLIAFFLSSTLLSRWKRKAKEQAESGYEKSGRRDAGQVAANGGLALVLCVAAHWWPHPAWWYAFLGVMASVTADTWATEVGGLSRTPPRSVLTGRRVAAGTSGGVTALGLAASMAGGLFVGVVAWLLLQTAPGQIEPSGGASPEWVRLAAWTALGLFGGTIGSLADSVLGATVQLTFRCRVCGRDIERPHHCGQPAARLRGCAGWNNDAVNVAGSLAGGAAAVAAAWLAGLL
ncbi:DUF92 domain-containing protein [Paenibacillus flagellatus]|uniref:DUF92 domain-containing protein n=1 Tax=Paenibacillus flagellatus TaxID=2211139 RepID=A0A2V5KMF2_9BACL|nr:DUF92 domain-containing protein [Paenibacillus flagellatus]PYI56330.1 DUF92 domain-containing protein [Paenibacillus flagellatus]